jgi:beta-N-acetylhexosaminidase
LVLKTGKRTLQNILVLLLLGVEGFCLADPGGHKPTPPNNKYVIYKNTPWVDSILSRMTLEDKIGQLFMVAAFTSKDKLDYKELKSLVQRYHIGGLIFFKGNPCKEAEVTNSLQAMAPVPLWVGMDAEWGLAMRLDSTINFGYQMPLGAIQDDSVVYKMGHDIAMQCKRLGINVNFAPVVDVNNNPLNPVINMRSFGENKMDVSRKSEMYMEALQDEHILAVAKHFPGHGNVDVDSHLDLPVLNQSKQELDTLELFPFKYLFARGVGGVMTAHLHIPAYDTAKNVGASLSPAVTTGLLKRDMKFTGLAFSDALNMKGVSKYYNPGQLEVKALMAGNDILLYSEDVPRAIEAIKAAVDSGCIDESFINDKVRKILEAKQWAGLDHCQYIDVNNVTLDLNAASDQILKQHIAEQSVTIVKNDFNYVPLRSPGSMRIASVAVGTRAEPPLQTMMRNYCNATYFNASFWSKDTDWQKLKDTLKTFDLVVVSLHNLSNKHTDTYGLSKKAISFVNELNAAKPVILISMGSPYSLNRFPKFNTIIDAYQDDIAFQKAAVEALFGAIGAKGKLPVSACDEYHVCMGGNVKSLNRLRYTLPEEAGMSSLKLNEIDGVVANAIKEGAMPGCQIVVAKDGKVVYEKSFGRRKYNNNDPVENKDLYDLASVTKVGATTLAVMKLYDQGKIDIFATLGHYLPELRGTNKADLQIKEIMTHQAGLEPWIPFYKKTLRENGYPDSMYCDEPNGLFNVRVAEKLYMNRFYKDTIYNIIKRTPIITRGKYVYSDLGFILMQHVVESITGTTLDKYMDSVYYKPLGLATMTFKPREKYALSEIIPTEQDTYFRHQLVHGDVHDMAAAMLGGVSGNAGLFSNANDLAILMQMLLNGGSYAGTKYLEPETVKLFTSKQYEASRKGLGWDKPEKAGHSSPASQYASDDAYGHTGFTGTCIWVDPKYNLTYIFLSNRVYPTAANVKLAKMNVRTDIHDIIYKSFLYKYCDIKE